MKIRTPTAEHSRSWGAKGFTLLELMATIAVIGLISALVLPNLGATRSASLRRQARLLSGHLELARQRAITTGRAHRVLLFLEDGAWRMEWFGGDSPATQQPAEPLDLRGDSPLPLSPPLEENLEYRPVPSQFGNDSWLETDFFFEGVETPEGWLERGDVAVVFDRDGTTDAAEIVIADADGRAISLIVRPLANNIKIVEHED